MIQPLLIFSDYGIALLRVVLGFILFAHSLPKIKDFKGTSDWFGSVGFKPAKFWLLVVIFTELVGGLLLAFGLLTQIIAAFVALQFLVIIFKVNLKKGFVGGYEFDLLILATALFFAVTGGGILSADEALGIILY